MDIKQTDQMTLWHCPSASQVLLPATHGEHSHTIPCHHRWISICSLLWTETSSLTHNKNRTGGCKYFVPHLASNCLFRRVWFSHPFYIIFSGLMRMSRYPGAPQMFGQLNWALYSSIRQPKDGYNDLHEFQKLNRVHSILAVVMVTTRPQRLA